MSYCKECRLEVGPPLNIGILGRIITEPENRYAMYDNAIYVCERHLELIKPNLVRRLSDLDEEFFVVFNTIHLDYDELQVKGEIRENDMSVHGFICVSKGREILPVTIGYLSRHISEIYDDRVFRNWLNDLSKVDNDYRIN